MKKHKEHKKQTSEASPSSAREQSESNEDKTQEVKIKTKDQKIAELTDTLQRLQAEFENFKKRSEKENKHFVDYAEEKLITSLLPVMDSFELSLKNSSDAEKFKKGVELIFAQLHSALRSRGLLKINTTGKDFNAHTMDVLLTEKGKENKVLEELQSGYLFKSKVIRHAKVKIGKE